MNYVDNYTCYKYISHLLSTSNLSLEFADEDYNQSFTLAFLCLPLIPSYMEFVIELYAKS